MPDPAHSIAGEPSLVATPANHVAGPGPGSTGALPPAHLIFLLKCSGVLSQAGLGQGQASLERIKRVCHLLTRLTGGYFCKCQRQDCDTENTEPTIESSLVQRPAIHFNSMATMLFFKFSDSGLFKQSFLLLGAFHRLPVQPYPTLK